MSEYEEEYEFDRFEEEITKEIAEEAYDEWIQLASATLGDTAENYINAMVVMHDSNKNVVLKLDDKLANMQEGGSESFDMKPGLLAGSDYRVIPITHGRATPKSSEANKMPTQVYSRVKNYHYGQRFTSDTTRRKRNTTTGYKHQSSLYSGMMRPTKSDAKRHGDSFVTFRAVSSNSDPSSWWHPGFEPLNLIEKVKEHISQKFEDTLNKARTKDF
jgi:hypothetical protein